MSTERIYYKDSRLLEFSGKIIESFQSGAQFTTVLDKTAFYPTSGGQLHDKGQLNGVGIIDVIERTEGSIEHISESPVGKVGDSVSGQVDKHRRWKNKQMHTAQHILSRTFIDLVNADTVSVHLGEDYGAVELNISSLEPAQFQSVEKRANEIILDSLPISVLFIEKSLLSTVPIRKPVERDGVIRVIKIGEIDWSACGGTHCDSTSEIGLIKIIGIDKMRKNINVRFFSGQQAMEDYSKRFDVTSDLSKLLTCHFELLPELFEKTAAQNKNLTKRIAELEESLLPAEIERIVGKQENLGKCNLVVSDLRFSDIQQMNRVAQAVAERISGIVCLFSENKIVIGAGKSAGISAKWFIQQLCKKTGLRGGGNDSVGQVGGVELRKVQEYAEAIKEVLRNAKSD